MLLTFFRGDSDFRDPDFATSMSLIGAMPLIGHGQGTVDFCVWDTFIKSLVYCTVWLFIYFVLYLWIYTYTWEQYFRAFLQSDMVTIKWTLPTGLPYRLQFSIFFLVGSIFMFNYLIFNENTHYWYWKKAPKINLLRNLYVTVHFFYIERFGLVWFWFPNLLRNTVSKKRKKSRYLPIYLQINTRTYMNK